MLTAYVHLTLLLGPLTGALGMDDPSPQDKDVKAGWVAGLVFVLLIVAVAYIGYSFSKQMKKVAAAKEAGVFDDPADDDRK